MPRKKVTQSFFLLIMNDYNLHDKMKRMYFGFERVNVIFWDGRIDFGFQVCYGNRQTRRYIMIMYNTQQLLYIVSE